MLILFGFFPGFLMLISIDTFVQLATSNLSLFSKSSDIRY